MKTLHLQSASVGRLLISQLIKNRKVSSYEAEGIYNNSDKRILNCNPEKLNELPLLIYDLAATGLYKRVIKIDMSAGFTPLILNACPIVVGFIFINFCLASLARLGIFK